MEEMIRFWEKSSLGKGGVEGTKFGPNDETWGYISQVPVTSKRREMRLLLDTNRKSYTESQVSPLDLTLSDL